MGVSRGRIISAQELINERANTTQAGRNRLGIGSIIRALVMSRPSERDSPANWAQWHLCVDHFGDALKAINPKFNRVAFKRECSR